MIPNTDSSAAPSARGRRLAAIATFLLLSTPLVFARVTLATCGHSPKGPAARVAGEEIGYAEVEELVASQLRQLEQQRHELMSNALDRLVENRLLELEAGRQETTVEVLLAAERGDTAVTDAEVDAWYEANQARIRQPKEQVADQVRGFLEQQQIEQARQRLLQDLDSRYAVEKLISPYRLAADVGPAPVRGHGDAPVKVVLYSDFECPYCQRVRPTLEMVKSTYSDRVRLVFRQFPLSIHPNAPKAAEASLCARDQGKFWEMHD
ncbi:MAG: thioredoxin domain-containing protein, partial [Holophagales bacterium]|nr:thioredoxin domain-containing protein [Holophagales bacterium]